MLAVMKELWQRLRTARDHAGKTQQNIADLFGITREAVAQWEAKDPKKRTQCPLQKLAVIAEATNVDFAWLATNAGSPPGAYKPPSEASPPRIEDYANVCPAPDLAYAYPLISMVEAGLFSEAIDTYPSGDGEEWIRSPVMMSKHGFALRVVGHSMEPNFPPGRIILVDPELRGNILIGDYVVARLCNACDVTFKRFDLESGRPVLVPLNKQYQVITEPFEIVGKVVADMNIY